MHLVESYASGHWIVVVEPDVTGLSCPTNFDEVLFVKPHADCKSVAGLLRENGIRGLPLDELRRWEGDTATVADQWRYVETEEFRHVWIILPGKFHPGTQNRKEDWQEGPSKVRLTR
jgi:hypothetical protein